MPTAFRFILYSGQRFQEATVFGKLWTLLHDPLLQTTRFDNVERAKHEFTVDSAPARRLFRSGSLFVRGRRDRVVVDLHEVGGGLTTLHVYLTYKTWNPDWQVWIERLARELPILFGLGATKQEYDRKHQKIALAPDGRGHAVGAVGMSIAEFYKYLPGIYWVTLFGPELSASLDVQRAATIPGVTVRPIDGQQRLIAIEGPPEAPDLDARLAIEAKIADALGNELFFDRDRELSLRQVPSLSALLERLKEPS